MSRKYGVNVSRLKGNARIVLGDHKTSIVIGTSETGTKMVGFGYMGDKINSVPSDVRGFKEQALNIKATIDFEDNASISNLINVLVQLRKANY